jgi:hypothetical protein
MGVALRGAHCRPSGEAGVTTRAKVESLFGGNLCSECGKPHDGNYLLEIIPRDNGGRHYLVTCDECRRLHWEADVLMGLIPPAEEWPA